MQEKLHELLTSATGWLTASELADKGKWRSQAHVGLALKSMPDVEHRKSPTKKMGNGMPAMEYKLSFKVFDDAEAVVRKHRKTDVTLTNEGDMPTDKECCNAAKVVATTAGSQVNELNARIETLEEEISQRNREIKKLSADLGHARIQIDALNEQLMHGEDAVDVKDAAKGYLVCAPKRKPAKLMKAESAVARAKSAAKAAGRCEVFALVPVGIATRKQIQAVEFKERTA